MTLSAPAKKLLSEQPELVKGLIESYQTHSFQFYKEHTTKHGDSEIMWSWPGDVWDDFVQKATKSTCPHCGIPTDGTSNDQCYKAPQKEWEILAYKSNDSDLVLYRKEWVCLVETQHLYNIHSVKRLSDGEVFTVGDMNEYPTGNKEPIKEFKVSELGLFFRTDGIWSHIQIAKKPIKPLFTTNDGKPVYEGDKIYWIPSDIGLWDIQEQVISASLHKVHRETIKYFSTKSAAEEYIIWNKPLLSLHEICNVFQKNCLYHDSKDGKRKKIEAELIELSKQKT